MFSDVTVDNVVGVAGDIVDVVTFVVDDFSSNCVSEASLLHNLNMNLLSPVKSLYFLYLPQSSPKLGTKSKTNIR